jgi:nitroimidazol reductase NimA-like FMN-containing flavoprotein (pyridoxamine 5'-phosphate oxidase superfamily)
MMRAILMKKTSQLKEFLKDLFASQRLAVLATQGKRQSYGNLVAFVATNDLKHLLFATTRATRKYANISENPRVAMVIDNRSNQETDFHQAAAVTATGVVKEVEGIRKESLLRLYLSKHPYLKDFVSSPTCALLRMHVETYYVVRQFQNVMELHIRK